MAKNVVPSTNLGYQILFDGLYLYCMLDIVPIYHYMQFQGKLTNEAWKMVKNLVLGQILTTLDQIWDQNFFFIDSTCTSS